ncbi:MAG: AAA family ATPase [Firmicutes bacterium]|nr:AAA family ATPase [Bacillota bacterium]
MIEVKRLEEILGQKEVVNYLIKDLETKNYNHAYMFFGKRGIGKKTMALAFAKSIICQDGNPGFCGVCSSCKKFDMESYMEFISFYDQGETIKIENIRRILEEEHLKKYEGAYRIIFMEHAERMTKEAANSILKVLEEPFPGTIFVFTATNPDDILPTIISRVEKYYLNNLNQDDLGKIMTGLGYNDNKYLSLGSIDEARVLLDNLDQDLLDYQQFCELFARKDLIEIFELAEKLAKKPYLRELFSYYQLEAMAKYREDFEDFNLKVVGAIDNALRKIKINVNEKHALEYCFLTIGGIFSE